jgi:glycosyltransferase involved in cell wall biosynthesis
MGAPRILLSVTGDGSLVLMQGFPDHLVRRGWDVHVVCSPGPSADALEAGSPVTVHRLPMDRDPAPTRDLAALVSWVRLLRDVRPDVLSVGTPKAGLLGGVAGFLTRVHGRVYLLRGLRYETSTGTARRVLLTTERVACAVAHDAVAVSSSLRTRALDDRLLPAPKISVLGHGSSNGVDLARFATTPAERRAAQAERWPGEPRLPVLGFIGRVHPDKGVDLLADALAELSGRGRTGRLLVVGSPDAGGDLYEERLRATGFRVEFTGSVPDVVPYLRLMDVLCLPTKREGFPNVVLEAGAAGIPTVATRATGIDDAVVDGRTGLVAASRDPRELADLLESVLCDEDARARMGREAREMVAERFARPAVWERYEAFYRSRLRT